MRFSGIFFDYCISDTYTKRQRNFMKRLIISIVALLFAFSMQAQIIISSDFLRNPDSDVRIKLLDSLTSQPLVMATVYLQPKGDTTIMYFNLTDTSGVAVLEDVVRGNYRLTAEFMGYKPFVKEFYFSKQKEDAGTVKMVEDAIMLEAAKVTAVGNAIEIKQDTLIYNASMFRTADNAVLADLLKKMPGFEVSKNGQVTNNGQTVSKITVNGKTFFFDDPTMAVNNLPAKIVDKIKITDTKSDKEKSTGISDMSASQQKEMDISLKKEYEKGWFGNAKLAAGAPIDSKSDEQGMLVGGKDFMYNGNVMLSGYNDKDQVTIIGNMLNTPNTGANDMIVVMYGGEGVQTGRSRPTDGLTSSQQLGANFNTSRIKGFSTSAMANYKGNLVESEKISQKTIFNGNLPDMFSNTSYQENYNDNSLDISLELRNNNREKVYAAIAPKFTYSKVKSDSYTGTGMEQDGELLNSSSAISYLEADNFVHRNDIYFTLKNLGKAKRSITLSSYYYITDDDSRSKEFSEMVYQQVDATDQRNLYYKSSADYFGYSAGITYVEPLGKNWILSTALNSSLQTSDVVKDAYRQDGNGSTFVQWFGDVKNYSIYDDYYSSVSNYRYFRNSAELLAQYSKGKTNLQFGAMGEVVNNWTYSKSYGISQTTGKGEQLWNMAPFLRFSHTSKNGGYFSVRYSGRSNALDNSKLSTVPDISNPSYITVGNIYLRTPFKNSFTLYYNLNNKKNFSYWYASVDVNNSTNEIVYANWFDKEGVQYNVPVNSSKGSNTVRLSFSGSSIPLNESRSLTVGGSVYMNYSGYYSYQNVSGAASIDTDSFNYTAFMDEFWGNAAGNRFYSGASGFKESKTDKTNISVSASLRYKSEGLSLRMGGSAGSNMVEYSLNSKANMNTWDYRTYITVQYDSKKQFSLISDMDYRFYSGYTNGYGQPAFNWNIEAYKTVKAFTFGLKVNDVLNQTTNFTRSVSGNYVEDSYRNVVGRHFLISLTFNFGKMNSGKSTSANRAMMNMMM